MLSVTTLCTVCALSFIAVPPKGEVSSSEGGKCPVTGLLTSSKTKAAEAAVPAEVGKMAPPFELMDTNGKAHKLSDFKGKTVVLEWFCARCPYSGQGFRPFGALHRKSQEAHGRLEESGREHRVLAD